MNGVTPQSDRLTDACRRHGIPVTAQRRTVYNAVCSRHDHPTADEILAQVRDLLPDVSRTTVYRVLERLVKINVLTKISTPGSSARYDAMLHRHHHLVCKRCERVFDLEDEQLDRVIHLPRRTTDEFEIDDFSVYFSGICARCRAAETGPTDD